MALIIYPDAGYNSFISVLEADEIINGFTNDRGWATFTTEDKEKNLKQAFTYMALCPKFKPPDDNNDSLRMAQALLTIYYIGTDPFEYDPNSAAVTREKLGSMEIEYQAGMKHRGGMVFPPYVVTLLKPYGCKGVTGTRQTRIGVA